MEQRYFNINVINAISALNKSIMSLQEKVIILAIQNRHTAHIADLTRVDSAILNELQDGIDRIKRMVEQ